MALISPAEIVERDDGRFAIGLADDAPAFESRAFALRVASGHPPEPAPARKFRRIRTEVRNVASA